MAALSGITSRRLELRAFPEPDVRPARHGIRRGARSRLPERGGEQIQELLLDETPIIFPYFYNFLSAASRTCRARSRRRRASSISRRRASRPDPRTRRPGSERARPPTVGLQGPDGTLPPQAARPRRRHALPAQRDRVFRHPDPARATSPAASSARSRDQEAVDKLNEELGTDRPLLIAVLATGSASIFRGDLGTSSRSACRSTTCRDALVNSLKLARRVRDRRAARDPRRRHRGAERDQLIDRMITLGGLSVTVDPRVRHRASW